MPKRLQRAGRKLKFSRLVSSLLILAICLRAIVPLACVTGRMNVRVRDLRSSLQDSSEMTQSTKTVEAAGKARIEFVSSGKQVAGFVLIE